MNSKPPPQHPAFAGLLLLFSVLQCVMGALRPLQKPDCFWRLVWKRVHRACGSLLLILAMYILQHSVFVFHITGWLRQFVLSVVAVAVVACALGVVWAIWAVWAPPFLMRFRDGYQPTDVEEGLAQEEHSDNDLSTRCTARVSGVVD